ncbi:alpha/beta fold hydrolase [Streptomyces lydicus]|uniref:alpha/beta fold hydrolase n=1 Tax=Streptomyces lydicus TaxID=47763 RepID=UPI001F2B2BBD|nr:alpha/beta hydrolase [Streptomyces lydicus]
MGTAVFEEITIGYEDRGTGEALVLVHGHPFNRSMWRPQIEHFARAGWRVIAPDLRGYGESSVVPGTTPLETFVRDTVALLDRLGIERFVLGGLSMGGQIVMEFHRLFPDRIRAVVLADTFAAAETAEGRAARHAMADRLVREGMDGYAHEVLTKMIAPHTAARRPEVARHVLGMMTSTPPEGAAAALRGRAERPDYTDLLADIAVPVLVVVGADDEYTPVSDARVLHEGVPDGTLAVIEGAAHMPNLEREQEFNAVLAEFLDGLPAVSAPAAQRAS